MSQGLNDKRAARNQIPDKYIPEDDTDAPITQSRTGQPEKITHKEQVNLTEFSRFNPQDLPDSFTMLVSAPRGSGKTHLLKHVLRDIRSRFKHAYLFSETAFLQEGAYEYIPGQNIYNGFDEFAIDEICNRQKDIRERNKSLKKKFRIYNPVLIVLDDVVNDKNLQKSAALKNLFTLGRHMDISVCILLQNLSSRDGVSTIIRKNVDCFVMFNTHDVLTREMASESFASIIGKKEGMCVMSAITEEAPYQACVCLLRNKQHGKSSIKKYCDYIYKYLAPADDPKKFMIGTKKDKIRSKAIPAPQQGPRFQFLPAGRQALEFEPKVSTDVANLQEGVQNWWQQ